MIRTVLIMLVLSQSLWPQGSSTITGTVDDGETKEPLIGVNVMVKGTYFGATTDLNGSYTIEGLSPGSYDLEISYIGYRIIQKTAISVSAGETIQEDFSLESTVLAFGEDVIVIGKKALFDVAETASAVRMSSKDIESMIVDDLGDILAQSAGVSATDNEVHVRGGRLDETLFIIDGVAVKDPLTGYGANLYINADAIDELEILTGGYNAEYGQAMSGVINVTLKSGSEKMEGSLKYSSDEVGLPGSFGMNRVEFNLGGRSLWDKTLEKVGINLPGKFFSFIVGYGKAADTQLPSATKIYPHNNFGTFGPLPATTVQNLLNTLAVREENDWHGMYKVNWELTPTLKVTSMYDVSLNINQGFYMPRAFSSTYFPYRYQNILDNYNTMTRTAVLYTTILNHTISPQSFYSIKLAKFTSREHSAVRDLNWTEYREHLDLSPTLYNPSTRDGDIRVTYGDEFYDAGMSSEWYDLFSSNTILKADWTYHFSDRQKMKTGIEHNFTDLQVVDIDEPWTGSSGLGSNYDIYQAKTQNGSFYYQHNILFEGMIINGGMRYDFWIPGEYLENAVDDTNSIVITDAARTAFYDDSYSALGKRVKGHLSPRLGVSHPVTDNDVLYFYYGHFSQQPSYQYVFAKLNGGAQGTYQIIGNPTLNPKTTVQYEIGLKHRFNADQILELKAYWKNAYNYETSETITSDNPRYAHLRFNMYFNADYARSRGVEAVVRSRFWKYFQSDGTVSYSIATGKSSSPNDNLLVQAGALREKPLGENFLAWDRPFRAFGNISFYYPKTGSQKLLREWGISVRADYETGRRYTSNALNQNEGLELGLKLGTDGKLYYDGTPNDDTPYTEFALTPRFYIDLKIYKDLTAKSSRVRLFVEVENLLDERIPRRINSFTGRGYGPGEIYSYGLINRPNPNLDPSRVERYRRVEAGIQVSF